MGITCFHLSTTGGLYTKLTARTENKEASWNRKEIPKEGKGLRKIRMCVRLKW